MKKLPIRFCFSVHRLAATRTGRRLRSMAACSWCKNQSLDRKYENTNKEDIMVKRNLVDLRRTLRERNGDDYVAEIRGTDVAGWCITFSLQSNCCTSKELRRRRA